MVLQVSSNQQEEQFRGSLLQEDPVERRHLPRHSRVVQRKGTRGHKTNTSVHHLVEQASHLVAIMYLAGTPSAIKTIGDSSLWVNEGKYVYDRCFPAITGVFSSVC